MPVLKNPRHERFAQLLAKGKNATAAYREAGYKDNDGNASELKGNERVSARVAELQAAVAERAIKAMAKSKGDIVARLDDMIEIAEKIEQPGAGVQGLMGQAKILGHITEKHQVEITAIKDMTLEQCNALLAKS